jgi:hypothetical protein
MTRPPSNALLQALLSSTVAWGALGLVATAMADDPPPPATAPVADPSDGPRGRHHDDPAWQACKKQADDQKLARGDARRDFIKNCVKAAKDPAHP